MLRSAFCTLLALLACGQAHAAITFKQGASWPSQATQSTVTVAYAGVQTAGDLNVVIVAWDNATSSVSSVTDSKGNAYSLAMGPTVRAGQASQSIYYARNIAAATAGSNVVTVTFSTAVPFPDIRVLEYGGVDTVSPLHATAGSNGLSTTTSSGAMNVTVSNALLVAANYVEHSTTGAGTGFTSRMISIDSSIAEDSIVTATGSYTGTAPQDASGWWIMQMVAFKAASSDTQAPSAPTGLTAPAASAGQINLSWTASTDNVAVTGYRVERCSGASCTTFAQVATPTATSFSDTGLTASTSYSYRVRATDAAGNLSGYSSVASATTPALPNVPTGLNATGGPGTQANLNWTDASTNETGFKIERKLGASGTYAQIAVTAANATTFADSGLTAGSTYFYRIRATNAAGDSAYSNEAGAATPVPDVTGTSTVIYRYDAFGNLIQTIAGGVSTTVTYDVRGRKTGMSDPDMGNWAYTYNALGQLIRQVDAKSQTSSITYDLLGRMTTRIEADLTSKWFYDSYPTTAAEWNASLLTSRTGNCAKGVGKLCYASADNGYRRLLTYDNLGRPLESNTLIDTAYVVTTTYDSLSRVATVTYPDNFAIKNGYNGFGYLSEVRNNADNTLYWTKQSVSISSSGTIVQDGLGNTLTSVRTYDILARLTSATASGTAGTAENLSYSYDTIGNVTQRVDSTQAVTETFAYDTLNRLLQASGPSVITRSFDYDAIGNIIYKSDVGVYSYGAKPHAVASISGTVTASYIYDPNGNLTSGAGRTVNYTTFNLPLTISQGTDQFQYTYDADHQRVRLDVTRATGVYTTIYLNPAGGAGLFYEKESKPGGTVEYRHYVNGAGLIGAYVTTFNGATQVSAGMRYYHTDNLGSIVAVTNDAGASIETLAYEAYGKRRFPNGTADPNNTIFGVTTERGFTGHEHLDEIGLVHMNGRVYDPLLGRFMTADPTVENAGNLETYNRYSYTANNPLGRVDRSGFGWGSRFSHFVNWAKQNNMAENGVQATHALFHGQLAANLQYSVHSSTPISIWGDRYVQNHPSVAPYVQMAETGVCSFFTVGMGAAACAAGVSVYNTGLMGGSNSDMLRAGAISFATAAAMAYVGDVTGGHGADGSYFLTANHVANIAGHALVGCASAAASGGSCRSGALSGAAGSLAAPFLPGPGDSVLDKVGGLVASAIVGGTASALGGGRFANGANTAAFGYLFNQTMLSGFERGTTLDAAVEEGAPFRATGIAVGEMAPVAATGLAAGVLATPLLVGAAELVLGVKATIDAAIFGTSSWFQKQIIIQTFKALIGSASETGIPQARIPNRLPDSPSISRPGPTASP